MVTVHLVRNGRGRLISFKVSGHAGYDDYGQDIVCAAVSVLTQTAILGLVEHLGLWPLVDIRPGYLECTLTQLPKGKTSEAIAIVETMVLGLENIAAEYPGFVTIFEEEVE